MSDYVWRVVIDRKPRAPLDWLSWATSNRFYFTRFISDDEMDEFELWFLEEVSDVRRQYMWDEWRAGRRMRYLSPGAAYRHMQRLTDHGVIAHVERGVPNWTTPSVDPLSPESHEAVIASLRNSLRVANTPDIVRAPTTKE